MVMRPQALGQDALGGLLVWIDRTHRGPPWPMYVQNERTGAWERVGSLGGGGAPLLAPGGLRRCAEIVVFPADPPEPVTLGGDYVYLVPYQPDFTLGLDGDLTLLEGGD